MRKVEMGLLVGNFASGNFIAESGNWNTGVAIWMRNTVKVEIGRRNAEI
jgi:hypothetical protein